MEFSLKNKNILIIGASKGLGEYLARYLSNGTTKTLLVARNEIKLKKIQNELYPNYCEYISLNMLEENSIEILFSFMKQINFEPDIVIHNMGGALGKNNPLSKKIDFFDVWNFNVGVQIELNSKIIPKMIKNGWGRVVSISSILGKNGGLSYEPFGGSIQYNTAKAYLNSYNKILGRELAQHNIVVSTVMPGVMLSEGKYWDKISKSNPKLVKEFLKTHVSTNRFGLYEEVAPFVLLLCSEYASYCSGLEINIDGGWK
jgi:NAD(P)-dependent dehydrogenase (short-subunit alcohol dehydrogenase family)